jgi:hypothetical protein
VVTAAISGNWHLYSQSTSAGGPVATTLTFVKNPMIIMDGAAIEKGEMITKNEPLFGVDVKYYGGGVSFCQAFTLRTNVKTKLNGTVRYMVCNDRECLPPKNYSFTVDVK